MNQTPSPAGRCIPIWMRFTWRNTATSTNEDMELNIRSVLVFYTSFFAFFSF